MHWPKALAPSSHQQCRRFSSVVAFVYNAVNTSRDIRNVVRVAEVTLKTRSLVFARLYWRARCTRRRVPGTFRFPFGTIRYIDISSLLTVYAEIFVDREYDLAGMRNVRSIIDCGGNVGMAVIRFKQQYPHARITVFEADPAIAEVLEQNVRALRLESVEVVSAAVTGDAGPVTFLPAGPLTGHVGDGTGLTIESVRLSDRIRQPVDLLKIDVEGSEFGLVADLCATGCIRFVKNIVCEVHGTSAVQGPLAELWAGLTRAGFRVTVKAARTHAKLPGPPDPTPFSSVESGKFLLMLYAWQP